MSEVFPKAGSSRLEWLRQRPALLRCLPPNYDLKSSTIPCNQPPLPDSSAYPTDITLLSPSNFKVVSSCHTKSSLICIITNSFLFSALLHYESFLCIRRKLFSRCLFVPPLFFFFLRLQVYRTNIWISQQPTLRASQRSAEGTSWPVMQICFSALEAPGMKAAHRTFLTLR